MTGRATRAHRRPSGALPLAAGAVALRWPGSSRSPRPACCRWCPGFLGYVTGLSDVALEQRGRGRTGARRPALRRSASPSCSSPPSAFVVGRRARRCVEHRTLLMRVGGVVVIAHGAGLPRAGHPARGSAAVAGARRPAWPARPLLGAVFGARLGAVHRPHARRHPRPDRPAHRRRQRRSTRGVVLAVAYSLGLGLPFLLIAAGSRRAGRASAWLRRHQRGIQRGRRRPARSPSALLLVTGVWDDLDRVAADRLVTGFTDGDRD